MHSLVYRIWAWARATPKGRRIALALAFATIHVGEARAEEPKMTAAMQCERAAEPGRVKCSVEARTTGNGSISWADVALLELPDFAAALKGRIGPSDAIARDATTQKWAFALVARRPGQGEARARVRAVVCEPAAGDAGVPRCAATTIDVKAIVHVG
jgi:hypothetical protein